MGDRNGASTLTHGWEYSDAGVGIGMGMIRGFPEFVLCFSEICYSFVDAFCLFRGLKYTKNPGDEFVCVWGRGNPASIRDTTRRAFRDSQ